MLTKRLCTRTEDAIKSANRANCLSLLNINRFIDGRRSILLKGILKLVDGSML